jgi:hypothetical protein
LSPPPKARQRLRTRSQRRRPLLACARWGLAAARGRLDIERGRAAPARLGLGALIGARLARRSAASGILFSRLKQWEESGDRPPPRPANRVPMKRGAGSIG